MDVTFKYFLGPESEMSRLQSEPSACDLCGERRHCFALEFACLTKDREGPRPERGCPQCLKAGRFYFSHNTEAGFIDGAKLRRERSYHRRPPEPIPPLTVIELGRTPGFHSWQEAPWLIHCGDFMAYLGEWKPADFRRADADGSGRRLFLEMTDGHHASLWDEAAAEAVAETGNATFEDWYPTYYAFRCLHCGKLRGTWDCL